MTIGRGMLEEGAAKGRCIRRRCAEKSAGIGCASNDPTRWHFIVRLGETRSHDWVQSLVPSLDLHLPLHRAIISHNASSTLAMRHQARARTE